MPHGAVSRRRATSVPLIPQRAQDPFPQQDGVLGTTALGQHEPEKGRTEVGVATLPSIAEALTHRLCDH